MQKLPRTEVKSLAKILLVEPESVGFYAQGFLAHYITQSLAQHATSKQGYSFVINIYWIFLHKPILHILWSFFHTLLSIGDLECVFCRQYFQMFFFFYLYIRKGLIEESPYIFSYCHYSYLANFIALKFITQLSQRVIFFFQTRRCSQTIFNYCSI